MSGAGGRITLGVQEARELALAALQGSGHDASDAAIITEHLIDAALCGYETSGLPKILNVAENPRQRGPRSPMRVEHETALSLRYDAGNLNGMVAIHHATDAAICKARLGGIAVVGVRNRWTSGRGAYFVSQSLAEMKATPRAEGVTEITLPGERSRRRRALALLAGIEIDDHIHRALMTLANAVQNTPIASLKESPP